jgi:thiamine phosphate synthase YjbQ (UPF0047 family)
MQPPVTIKTPVQNGGVITYLSGSTANPKELAFAAEKKDVYVSSDFGTTWKQIANQGQAINHQQEVKK